MVQSICGCFSENLAMITSRGLHEHKIGQNWFAQPTIENLSQPK